MPVPTPRDHVSPGLPIASGRRSERCDGPARGARARVNPFQNASARSGEKAIFAPARTVDERHTRVPSRGSRFFRIPRAPRPPHLEARSGPRADRRANRPRRRLRLGSDAPPPRLDALGDARSRRPREWEPPGPRPPSPDRGGNRARPRPRARLDARPRPRPRASRTRTSCRVRPDAPSLSLERVHHARPRPRPGIPRLSTAQFSRPGIRGRGRALPTRLVIPHVGRAPGERRARFFPPNDSIRFGSSRPSSPPDPHPLRPSPPSRRTTHRQRLRNRRRAARPRRPTARSRRRRTRRARDGG